MKKYELTYNDPQGHPHRAYQVPENQLAQNIIGLTAQGYTDMQVLQCVDHAILPDGRTVIIGSVIV